MSVVPCSFPLSKSAFTQPQSSGDAFIDILYGDDCWSQNTWFLTLLSCSQVSCWASATICPSFIWTCHTQMKGWKAEFWSSSGTYQNLSVFLSCSPVTIELHISWFLNTGEENSAALWQKRRLRSLVTAAELCGMCKDWFWTWRKGAKSYHGKWSVCILFINILPLQGSWEQVQLSTAFAFARKESSSAGLNTIIYCISPN